MYLRIHFTHQIQESRHSICPPVIALRASQKSKVQPERVSEIVNILTALAVVIIILTSSLKGITQQLHRRTLRDPKTNQYFPRRGAMLAPKQ
jgi:hypothetical protein